MFKHIRPYLWVAFDGNSGLVGPSPNPVANVTACAFS